MAKQAAGILVFKRSDDRIEVLMVHHDGPFWAKKDVWSIPKGELKDHEDQLTAAKREFEEELGFSPPKGEFISLGSLKQSGGKTNYIWTVESDVDLRLFNCKSTVKLEWPPHSGKEIEFPEIDKAEWFEFSRAKSKVFKSQVEFLDRLAEELGIEPISTEPESEQSSLF